MSFYGITDLGTFVLGTIGIVLLPGPNSLYVLATASTRGVWTGYTAAFGVFVGDAVLMLLTALGAAGLLHTYPTLFMLVKYAGAAYLGWLGLGLLRSAYSRFSQKPSLIAQNPMDQPRDMPAAQGLLSLEHPFTRALFISLLNPKAILFFLSFFVQFVDSTYPYPAVPFLIEGAIVQFCSALYLSMLIFSGDRLAKVFRQYHRLSAGLSACVGILFVGFGIKLASSSIR